MLSTEKEILKQWTEQKIILYQDNFLPEQWKELVSNFRSTILSQIKMSYHFFLCYPLSPLQGRFFKEADLVRLLQDAFPDYPKVHDPIGWEYCTGAAGMKHLSCKTSIFKTQIQRSSPAVPPVDLVEIFFKQCCFSSTTIGVKVSKVEVWVRYVYFVSEIKKQLNSVTREDFFLKFDKLYSERFNQYLKLPHTYEGIVIQIEQIPNLPVYASMETKQQVPDQLKVEKRGRKRKIPIQDPISHHPKQISL